MAGKGFEAKAAIKRAATWGTAVAVSPGDGFYFLSESIGGGPSIDEDMSLTGKAWGNEPALGSELHEGGVTSWLRYGAGAPIITALGLGSDTVSVVSAGGGVYDHQMTLTDTNSLIATLCIGKDVDVWEYPSVAVSKITWSGSGGDRVQMVPEFMCRSLERDSATNTTTIVNAATVYGHTKPVYFTQGVLRINTDAGALDTADAICPSSFEIVMDNGFTADFLACGSSPHKAAAPVRNTFGKVTGFFELPERSDQTYDDMFYNETTFKADFTFTATATIAAGYYYTWTFEIPYARVTSFEAPVTGPERIKRRVEFQAFEADSTPTGLYSAKPLNVIVRDAQSSAYTTTSDFS